MGIGAKVEWVSGVAVVGITGEVDLATVDQFASSIEETALEAPGVVIDLTGVTYLDSSGVRALFQLAKGAPGVPMVAVIPRESVVRRVLELVDLTSAVPLCETVEEAVKTLRQPA